MANSFQLLGLDYSWRVSVEKIRAAQRQCLIVSHPDRQTEAVGRAIALQESARINAAASELLDPLSRGNAIVQALAPAPRPLEPKQNPAFLMRMMELREAVDGAKEDEPARAAIAAEVATELHAIELETDTAMCALIMRPEVGTWVAAFDALNRLRAMRRAHEECAR